MTRRIVITASLVYETELEITDLHLEVLAKWIRKGMDRNFTHTPLPHTYLSEIETNGKELEEGDA